MFSIKGVLLRGLGEDHLNLYSLYRYIIEYWLSHDYTLVDYNIEYNVSHSRSREQKVPENVTNLVPYDFGETHKLYTETSTS